MFIINNWNYIEPILSFCTLLGVIYNICQNKKQLENIDIFFEIENEKRKIDIPLMRKNCDRAEVQGLLRTQSIGQDKYTINYLSTREYLNQLFEVEKGKSNEIIILLSESEKYYFYSK